MKHPIQTIYSFTRPHTMIGTAISVPALGVYSGGSTIRAVPAALFANLYITGLNQITDIVIDRINKPELPIANNSLSLSEAQNIVLIAAISAILLSLHSKILTYTTLSTMILGTLYSVKPFRFKENSILAALSIVIVRGVLINIGFSSYALQSFVLPKGPVLFFSIFALIIAIMKDTPDITGDFLHQIPSFALKFGRESIYVISASILISSLLITAVVLKSVVSIGAITMAILIYQRTKTTKECNTQESAAELYQFYWKCFYLCYFALCIV